MKEISCKTFYRKLQNVKKIPEMLGFDGDFPTVHPIAQFCCFLVKKLGKISFKTFQRKLGNFKKIPEMLGFDGEHQAVLLIAKFRLFSGKFSKKLALFNLTRYYEVPRKFLKCLDLMASS